MNGPTIALLSVLVAAVGIVVTIVLVPAPWWRNESSISMLGQFEIWFIRVANRGKGEATNVTLWVRATNGNRMQLEHWDSRKQGEAVEHRETLNQERGLKYYITWDQHPIPWWPHRKYFKPTSRTKPDPNNYDVLGSVH